MLEDINGKAAHVIYVYLKLYVLLNYSYIVYIVAIY